MSTSRTIHRNSADDDGGEQPRQRDAAELGNGQVRDARVVTPLIAASVVRARFTPGPR